jgi:hypothetical protein
VRVTAVVTFTIIAVIATVIAVEVEVEDKWTPIPCSAYYCPLAPTAVAVAGAGTGSILIM